MSGNITELLPPILTGAELNKALRQLPEAPTDNFRRNATQTERLIALSDLYDIYIPNQMAVDIYTKLYISLMRSLSKKQTKNATMQANQNHIAAHSGISKLGIMGGCRRLQCYWYRRDRQKQRDQQEYIGYYTGQRNRDGGALFAYYPGIDCSMSIRLLGKGASVLDFDWG